MARPNRLHEFASYNTLFTLSGVAQTEIDNKTFLTLPITNVIARSSGIGKDGVAQGGLTPPKDPNDNKTIQDLKGQLALLEQRNNPDYAEGIKIVDRAQDIFFENVNILSVPSPNNERNLADFSKMEFELVEPFGITFIEKLRAVAFRMGFKDYMDAPFLLTIEFTGFDNQGRKIHNIGKNKKRLQRKIPVFITNVEFDVAEGGATYFVTAVPYPDRAYDDSFKYPRTNQEIEFSTISEFIVKIENLLNVTQMDQEYDLGARSGKKFYDKYKFRVDPALTALIGNDIYTPDKSIHRTESVSDGTKKSKRNNNLSSLNKAKGLTKQKKIIELLNSGKITEARTPAGILYTNTVTGQTGLSIVDLVLDDRVDPVESYSVQESAIQSANQDQNTPDPAIKQMGVFINGQLSLIKAFEDVIRSTKFFQGLTNSFWTTFIPMAQGVGPAGQTMTEADVRRLINSPGQQERLQKIVEKNPFVPWFKIKANTKVLVDKGIDPITKMHPKEITYYAVPCSMPVHKFLKAGQSIAALQLEQQAVKKYNYLYTGENVDVQNLKINYQTAFYQRNVTGDPKTRNEDGQIEKDSRQNKFSIIGQDETEREILGVRSYPSTLKGRNSADKASPLTAKSQEFYDYLTNPEADMLKIELEILGDPAYICQDMYTPPGDNGADLPQGLSRDEVFSETFECFNADSFLPLIFLKYRLPTDLNESKGTMFFNNDREQNLFFTGMYHVARIESSINQNSFTQVLHCNRLLNQEAKDAKPFVVKYYGGMGDVPYGDDNPPSVI